MSVKAKFKCDSVTTDEYGKEVKLSAVCGNAGENADFTKYTPSGSLSMRLDKDAVAASEYFAPGKEYYIVFDAVE